MRRGQLILWPSFTHMFTLTLGKAFGQHENKFGHDLLRSLCRPRATRLVPFARSNPQVCSRGYQTDLYPRTRPCEERLSHRELVRRLECRSSRSLHFGKRNVIVDGRVVSIRTASSKLAFIDLVQNGVSIQCILNFQNFRGNGVAAEVFREFLRSIKKGDFLSRNDVLFSPLSAALIIEACKGSPSKSRRGHSSLVLSEIPERVSPCLRPFPLRLSDPESRIRGRHIDFIINARMRDLVKARSEVISFLRNYLLMDDQLEVQTPILTGEAGGAIARSFQTASIDCPERDVNLRIAPELWLKRLVIGGFDRVFEIGPSFRNEGIDSTHNPEFTSCEFYRAHTSLNDLIRITEEITCGLADRMQIFFLESGSSLVVPELDLSRPFGQLDFIEELQSAMGCRLPDLSSPDATGAVARILNERSIPSESNGTLPQMLDRLSATFIEPRCIKPTFIINHPECLSPLSKTFRHPLNGQVVAARAELFISARELVNTYEEENSPNEQRRKLYEQIRYRQRQSTDSLSVNTDYLDALEWGLPPTGGWGAGIERLCMLMTGSNRISDVLTFGTLRNLVAQRHAIS